MDTVTVTVDTADTKTQSDRKQRTKKSRKSKEKKKGKKRKKKKERLIPTKQRAPSAIASVAANTSVVRLRSTSSLGTGSPPPMEPRKSVINMLRRGQVVDDLSSSREMEPVHEVRAVEVVVRFRPINDRERAEEHRMLFRSEFNMENDEFALFLAERQKLIDSHSANDDMDSLKTMSVEAVCEWLESIGLDSYKKRFRRRKVNGEWMLEFPRFHEKKPLEIEGDSVIVFGSGGRSKEYKMDKVLSAECTQNEAFEVMGRPAVDRLLRGYNVTIFAFGQTGTGKTHTMFGWTPPEEVVDDGDGDGDDGKSEAVSVEEDGATLLFEPEPLGQGPGGGGGVDDEMDRERDGLIPRMMDSLFAALSSDDDVAYFVAECGFVEVYQERLRDLIRPRLRVQLRYVGMGSELINLSWHSLSSYGEMAELMATATSNRMTAATKMNSTSSRSHCVVVVRLEMTLRDGTKQSNRLTFGDLAGSEKVTKTGATGQRLSEAKNIVKSLFALKAVIRALSEKKAFVPYHDSVITKLLRDSLGGNGLTMICCTASGHAVNREETKSTLRFAEMAKRIETEAVVNRMVTRKEMESQINELREQLQYHRNLRNRKKSRFTSTDFRVLASQLADATQRAEESTQNALELEIQLLVKTKYTLELEQALNEHFKSALSLRAQIRDLRAGTLSIDQLDTNWLDHIGGGLNNKGRAKGDGDGDGDGDHCVGGKVETKKEDEEQKESDHSLGDGADGGNGDGSNDAH